MYGGRFRSGELPVLIVPLWNWNKDEYKGYYVVVGSNRTFMELKYLAEGEYIAENTCSNRTFMELK